MFSVTEHTFQALEYTFQALEHTFRVLGHNFSLGKNTFISRFINSSLCVYKLLSLVL